MLLMVKIFHCITSLSIRKQFLCESIDNDVYSGIQFNNKQNK